MIYAFNEERKREDLWAELEELAKKIDEPWMLMGDFNEIMNGDERIGKRAHCCPSQRFRDCMENCNMKLRKLKALLKHINQAGFSEIQQTETITRVALAELQSKLNQDPQNVEIMHQVQEVRVKFAEVSKALASFMSQKAKEILMAEYTGKEVEDAIFAIDKNKAPGPDGYGSAFFQDNWKLVGNDTVEVVLSFLNSGKILKEINTTTITLIPKTKCPRV
uniref:Uncharacterized protein n=1 Tax=Cannabis sativa TaxID=3483 RepID=A0A803P9P1_CANSA